MRISDWSSDVCSSDLRILLYFRERPTGNWGRVPKGVDGARQAVKLLDEGLNLGVLVDQRTTQGIALPLFGRPARTTLGIAKLAIDQDLPIVPVQIGRASCRERVCQYV